MRHRFNNLPRGVMFALVSAACVVGSAARVDAAMVLSAGALSSPAVVDFSQFGSFTSSAGPTEIGGLVGESITFTSTNSGSVVGSGGYGLASNGGWSCSLRNNFAAILQTLRLPLTVKAWEAFLAGEELLHCCLFEVALLG